MYAVGSMPSCYSSRIIFVYLILIALAAIHQNIIDMHRELSLTVTNDVVEMSLPVVTVVHSIPLSSRDVMVVGLNPALQRTITVPSIKLGQVNRAKNVEVGIGGKGQNVVIASTFMNLARPAQLLQFLGSGAEGDALAHLLATRAQVDTKYSIRSRSTCRTCLTILEEGSSHAAAATEIIEPSGVITEDEVSEMYAVVSDNYLSLQSSSSAAAADESTGVSLPSSSSSSSSVESTAVQGLAIMGSMPPGCPGDLYSNLIALTCDDSSKVLIDTTVGVLNCLLTCCGGNINNPALCCDAMLKINIDELCRLSGISDEDRVEISKPSIVSIASLRLKQLLETMIMQMKSDGTSITSYEGLSNRGDGDGDGGSVGRSINNHIYLAVTDGPHPTYFTSLTSGRFWQIQLPEVLPFPEIINPIGAGDAVASGTIHAWSGVLPFISRIQKHNEDVVTAAAADDDDNGAGDDNTLKEEGKEDSQGAVEDSEVRAGDGGGGIEITAEVDGDSDGMMRADGGELKVDDSEQVELAALTAFAWGISCGTASCATLRNSVFDLDIAQALYSQLNIEQLN